MYDRPPNAVQNVLEFRQSVYPGILCQWFSPVRNRNINYVCTCGGSDFALAYAAYTGCPSVKWDKAFALLISCIALHCARLLTRNKIPLDPSRTFSYKACSLFATTIPKVCFTYFRYSLQEQQNFNLYGIGSSMIQPI